MDGGANDALVRLLAETLGVPRSRVTLVGGTRCANPVQTRDVSPVAVYRQYCVPSWCVNRSSTQCDSLAARIATQVTAHHCCGSMPASTIDERFGRMLIPSSCRGSRRHDERFTTAAGAASTPSMITVATETPSGMDR